MSDQESRAPTLEDLVALCRSLNEAGAKYVIVGGMAMIQLGFTRGTEDIDLLIARGEDNERRVIDAVGRLPDHAALELKPGEIEEYQVIRVADEIVVDLMSKACGVGYDGAVDGIQVVTIDGVPMPFASAELMAKLKQGLRDKDRMDLAFLKKLLGK